MTGRYQQRFGFYTASDSRTGMPSGEITIADILKEAKFPLSDEQTKQMKEFSMENPDSFMMLGELFTEDQNKALMDAFGTQEGFGDMPPSPRGLFFVIMFENGDKPLTKGQVSKMKALEGDMMTTMQDMMAIFTPEQMALMPQMGGGF